MMQAFAENLIEAFRAPRLSARRVIAQRLSLRDCLLMVVLAFALQGLISGLLSPGALDRGFAGVGPRLAELALQVVLFFALTTGVHRIGARFGGKATPGASASVVAWHSLVTALLAPLNVIGMRAVDPEGGASLLFLLAPISVGVSIWLFASFVAEAHGFQRLGPVILVSVGGFMALGVVTMLFLGMVAGGSAPQ